MNLKPCPFCGGEVEIYSAEFEASGTGQGIIECEPCGVQMEDGFILEGYIRKNSKDGETKVKDAIIKRWNRRQHEN